MSHQFSVGDGQDGESVIRPGGAAQFLTVAMGLGRLGLSLKFSELTFPFSCGPSAEFAYRVCEPLLQRAHRAFGAWGAGGRTA